VAPKVVGLRFILCCGEGRGGQRVAAPSAATVFGAVIFTATIQATPHRKRK
jgi:hypothetical protein